MIDSCSFERSFSPSPPLPPFFLSFLFFFFLFEDKSAKRRMDRMNNCFIRNSDNPARVILFVNDVRRIDDLLASKSCGTGIKRIIYFRNCSGRYFSKKNSSLYIIYLSLSSLRFHWADCMCPNNPSMIELLHIYRGLQFKAINTFRANNGNLEKSVRSVETKKRIELVSSLLTREIALFAIFTRKPVCFRTIGF